MLLPPVRFTLPPVQTPLVTPALLLPRRRPTPGPPPPPPAALRCEPPGSRQCQSALLHCCRCRCRCQRRCHHQFHYPRRCRRCCHHRNRRRQLVQMQENPAAHPHSSHHGSRLEPHSCE
ncbi:unnamed protein product [Closterium sp. NIES-54]